MTAGAAPSLDELRAEARRHGSEPDDADLEGVAAFLAVFLPAVEDLAAIVPPDGAPAPLD
jgi:hypothetical protein